MTQMHHCAAGVKVPPHRWCAGYTTSPPFSQKPPGKKERKINTVRLRVPRLLSSPIYRLVQLGRFSPTPRSRSRFWRTPGWCLNTFCVRPPF